MRGSRWLALAAATALAASVAAQDWKGRARLDGRVTDPTGTPLEGATITVQRRDRPGGPVVTSDADGAWVADGIAAGSWVVEVWAPGYLPQRVGVHLPHESSWLAPLEVQLRRPPAPAAPGDAPGPPEPVADPPANHGPGGEGIEAALEAGRIERAHALLASLDGDVPGDDADTLVEMGALFLAAGEATDAVVVLDRAVGLDPAHVDARFRRALALLAVGRTDAARSDFETLLDLSPEGPLADKARLALRALAAPSAGETP
jgi:hypothetical protein